MAIPQVADQIVDHRYKAATKAARKAKKTNGGDGAKGSIEFYLALLKIYSLVPIQEFPSFTSISRGGCRCCLSIFHCMVSHNDNDDGGKLVGLRGMLEETKQTI